MHERERFDRMWTLDPVTGCHVWHAGTTWGYGMFWTSDGSRRAHRWIVEQELGPIADGMVVDHLCRNRACVNVEHLEVVTQRVNAERRSRTGEERGCVHGHPATEIVVKYYDGARHRYCLACHRERAEASRRADGARLREEMTLLARGVCVNGHVIASEADVRVRPGAMNCRACLAEQYERRKERRRAHR